MAVRADDVMLGRIILAGDAGYVDVARTVGVANRLAGDVSGTVGRQHLNRIAGRARETRQQIAGFHDAIGELQKFDVHEMIATVAVRDPVAHHELAVDDTDVVVTGTAGEYRRIASIAAVDVVVASGACDEIVAGATIDHIIVRRCTEEPVLVTGRVDMDVADVEVERAGRTRIGGVGGGDGNAVDQKVLDMQRASRRGVCQRDIDAGDRVGVLEAHREGLVTRRVDRRLEFQQSGYRLAVDQNLRLGANVPDHRAVAHQGNGRDGQSTGASGPADNDVIPGAAANDVVAQAGLDDVVTAAEIDDVGDR